MWPETKVCGGTYSRGGHAQLKGRTVCTASGANGRGLRETKLAEAVQQRCLVALEPWPGPAGAYSPLQGGKLEALHTELDEGSQVRLADPAYGIDIRTGAVILGQVP
jgi:hypothetical protein